MGGRTSGNAEMVSTMGLVRDVVLASHHAIGVPINNKIAVVDKASRMVSIIGSSSIMVLKVSDFDGVPYANIGSSYLL